jgi:uncharacterized membrane protein YoaK (UPF0700 family)
MRTEQTADTLLVGAILAASGGAMDAYSYLCRGQVFANAQTGNILLLGVSVSDGDWSAVPRYLFPILAFTVGILAAEGAKRMASGNAEGTQKRLCWQQYSLLLEMVCLMAACFMPQEANLVANALISLSCGIQVESFRKLYGNSYATTMCIGNLRSGTENLFCFLHGRDRKCLRRAMLYYSVILCFAAGAVAGKLCIELAGEYALLLSVSLLLAPFFMLFR